MTNKQKFISSEIKEKKPRHLILEGAVRSGKTILADMYWISILTQTQNKLFLMTGQTISSLKRNVLDDLSKMFDIDTHLNNNNEWKYNNNIIACFGADKSDAYKAMRGSTAAGWFGNEVTLQHQNTILEGFARCSERDSKIIWDTNPDKPSHFIKRDYIDKSGCKFNDGSLNILSFHFELEDNEFLDPLYIESLKQSIPDGIYYDRMIKGLWKVTDKAIYTNFDIVLYRPDLRKVEKTIYGLDFGYNNPTAFTRQEYVDDEIYVEGLIYRSGMLEGDIISELNRVVDNKDHAIYADSADPDKIKAIQNAGFNIYSADKSVISGINEVRKHKLHLINSNVNLISNFENYENKVNSLGEITEEPNKYNDHFCDCVRYATYSDSLKNIPCSIEKTVKIKDFYNAFQY